MTQPAAASRPSTTKPATCSCACGRRNCRPPGKSWNAALRSGYRPDPKSELPAKSLAGRPRADRAGRRPGARRIRWTEPPTPRRWPKSSPSTTSIAPGWWSVCRSCRRRATSVPFTFDSHTIMTETGIDSAWTFLLDLVHHRDGSRPICARWGPRCRGSTDPAPTNPVSGPTGSGTTASRSSADS
jgi:hypothetical protein